MEQHVGRFRIVRTLGEGGMGVVYAAMDDQLGREVALKMVKGAAGDASARERLLREARVAAGVNHPNVCQVFDVGEHEGAVYVAMELLRGEPLALRLARGPLPFREACETALGVLGALEALHAQGVVHRDLKPSNVFLTAHGVKLLDLGLALPLDEAARTETRLTQTGMIVGTPGFMPPEQWGGEPLGPAADVFGMGALLFEMLTGKPAFSGANVLEVYHAIVHQPPPSLAGGPAVQALDRLIQRALAPRPEDRPASAAAMAAEVRDALGLADGSEAPRARAVARLLVLPFRMLKPDAELDYLRLGLADALASSLAAVESLVVRSSQVAARFAETSDLAAVASAAQVDLVLTGTILSSGGRVRVTLELVEVPSGTVLRSHTVTADAGDVFALQDELARRVVAGLAGVTGTTRARPLQRDVPADPEAYEHYLRGNALAFNSAMLPQARDLYRAAVAKDPQYAPAWARLGRVHRVIAKYGQGDAVENRRLAEEAFRKALEINPDLAVAHNLFTYFEVEELGRADQALARLLDRGARHAQDADLFAGLVVALRFGGLLEASVAANQRTRAIDPGVRTSVAYTHWMRGDYERAVRADDEDSRWVHSYALPLLGRSDEAATICRAVVERANTPFIRHMAAANLAAILEDREACLTSVGIIENSAFRDPEGLYFAARNLAHVGEPERALKVLERVLAGGFHVPQALRRDPWLAPLRGVPRFEALVVRADAGHRRALALYREHGGESLLGPAG